MQLRRHRRNSATFDARHSSDEFRDSSEDDRTLSSRRSADLAAVVVMSTDGASSQETVLIVA